MKKIFKKFSFNKRFFHSSIPKFASVEELASEIDPKLPKSAKLSDIIDFVWKDEKVTSQCPDLLIRLTSLRGNVIRNLWQKRGNNPKEIQILAVGTTSVPEHLNGYKQFLSNFRENSIKESNKIKVNDFDVGYDLLSTGAHNARKAVLEYWNEHYNFPNDILGKMLHNSAIVSGGMSGLKYFADAYVSRAKKMGIPHRFIQPDNSFGTWWSIIDETNWKTDSQRRECFTVGTKSKNKLHLTSEDVKEHYSKNGKSKSESWYITPIGNPSGTKSDPKQLLETLNEILNHNDSAEIILDTVYLRTLSTSDANTLMSPINSNKQILDRTIFLDSFSKSHGLCRERLGMYFSFNEKLFTNCHASNIAFSAGPGVYKDYQFLALGSMSKSDRSAISELHEFWRIERKGLLKHLTSAKFSHLFEKDQSHITPDDIEKPCTLYIQLKVKPGVSAQQVFRETGALGVDSKRFLEGSYIRFAVATIPNPTYSLL